MTARSEAADDLIIEAARRAVAELAPEEEPFFDDVVRAWRRGPRTSPGSSVGFGVDEILLTELILPVIAGAVTEVLVAGGAFLARRRRERNEPPAALDVVAEEEITEEQRLREAVQRHAVTLGLTDEQAALLADAVIGALGPDSP